MAEVTVPDLFLKPVQTAANMCKDLGLGMKVVGFCTPGKNPWGTVCMQAPSAGSKVPAGTVIDVGEFRPADLSE